MVKRMKGGQIVPLAFEPVAGDEWGLKLVAEGVVPGLCTGTGC